MPQQKTDMFTGIIQCLGSISQIVTSDSGMRITISSERFERGRLSVGGSVAVSGVCLTAISIGENEFSADISNETIRCTRLGEYRIGSKLNLELPLTLHQPIGGHMVSGHVDDLARCCSCSKDGESTKMSFEVDCNLGKYIATKGSVAIDGVSLTVNEVEDAGELTRFSVNLIPHTLKSTTLNELSKGDMVHVEVDQIARYVERLMQSARYRGEMAGSHV